MVRKIFGIVVGFLVWTLIFVAGEPLLRMLVPDMVVPENATYFNSPSVLFFYLARSMVASLFAGFTAAVISKKDTKTVWLLGTILLLVGLFVQIGAWNMLPAWYHITFLIFLIPMTLLGGSIYKK